VGAGDLHRHGGADRLRDLGADRRADGDVVQPARRVVDRHLAALGGVRLVAEELVDVVLDRVAGPEPRPLLPVAREDPVGLAQRVDREVGSLLTVRLHVEAEPALALDLHHAVVRHGDERHGVEDAQEILVRHGRDLGSLDDAPVLVEDPAQIVLKVHGNHPRLLASSRPIGVRRVRSTSRVPGCQGNESTAFSAQRVSARRPLRRRAQRRARFARATLLTHTAPFDHPRPRRHNAAVFTALLIAVLIIAGATTVVGGGLVWQHQRRRALERAGSEPKLLGSGSGGSRVIERGPRQMRPGDIIQHDGRDWLVEGVVHYDEDGHRWLAGRLVDVKETRWLVAGMDRAGQGALLLLEPDPSIEVGSYPPEAIAAGERRYLLERRGTAT